MNANITEMKEVVPPIKLQMKYEMTEEDTAFVCKSREIIQDILHKKTDHFLVIVGPCSIHDYETAI